MKVIDPLQSYSFTVEVRGTNVPSIGGLFSKVSGLSVEYAVIDHKTFNGETGFPEVQRIPGRITYQPVTLARGQTTDLGFWVWHQMVAEGEIADARATVTVTMNDAAYAPMAKWVLTQAWPSRISGAEFGTEGNNFMVEELTLVFEHIHLDII